MNEESKTKKNKKKRNKIFHKKIISKINDFNEKDIIKLSNL